MFKAMNTFPYRNDLQNVDKYAGCVALVTTSTSPGIRNLEQIPSCREGKKWHEYFAV